MLYLYAFAEPPASLPDVRGIGAGALRAVAVDGVEAVVGEVGDTLRPSQEAILAHARVVDDLANTNAAVVPVRFGAAFDNDESLRSAVVSRSTALARGLARVRGCVELGLRVVAQEPAESRATPVSGRAYMTARLEETQRVERLAAELHGPLAKLSRAHEHRVTVTPQLLLSASYLVERENVTAFRAAVEELAAANPRLSLDCTGPWPAYSFGTVEVEA